MNSVLLDIGIEIIIAILLVPFSMAIENRFGVINSIKKIIYKIIPSPSQIKISIIFHSSQPFEIIKKNITDHFREKYKKISTKKNSSQTLEFMVDDSFLISVFQNPNDEVTIITNKIKSTTKDIKKDVRKILDVLTDTKDDISKSNFNEMLFYEKEFEIFLYLPFSDTYTKFYSPKNVIVKDFEVYFSDLEFDRVIKLKADYIKIQTMKRYELEEIIGHFV